MNTTRTTPPPHTLCHMLAVVVIIISFAAIAAGSSCPRNATGVGATSSILNCNGSINWENNHISIGGQEVDCLCNKGYTCTRGCIGGAACTVDGLRPVMTVDGEKFNGSCAIAVNSKYQYD